LPERTTVAAAAEWGIAGYLGRLSQLGSRSKIPHKWAHPKDKNHNSKWRWWRDKSPFRSWTLGDVKNNHLTVWARLS
jgi:hypothetical protein